jgi:hypothetical protein
MAKQKHIETNTMGNVELMNGQPNKLLTVKNELSTTLGALVKAELALGHLAAQAVSVKMAYHFVKLIRAVREETSHYYTQRDLLIKELGVERGVTSAEISRGMTGSIFEVKSENIEAYAIKMKDLIDLPVTITSRWLLTRALLEEANGTLHDRNGNDLSITLSAVDILDLDTLIIDEDD